MNLPGEWLDEQLGGLPEFTRAWRHALQHNLVDLDPWVLLKSEDRIRMRSEGLNSRYGDRSVVCFAGRQDADDAACVVAHSGEKYAAGQVLVIHDFASSGTEVDLALPEFWAWFKVAVDEMINTFQHWDDAR